MTTDMTVANTIVKQLGRSTQSLKVMIGAKDIMGDEKSLSFKFAARAKNGANYVQVTLEPSDTYTVRFVSLRGYKVTEKGTHEDVYAENLTNLFEKETGLYLSVL